MEKGLESCRHTLARGGGETLASVLVRKEGLVVLLRRAPEGRSLVGRRDEHERNIVNWRLRVLFQVAAKG